MRFIDSIYLHITDWPGDPDIEVIRKDHMRSPLEGGRGWENIGYHFVVRETGLVQEGRPLHIPGAHAEGYNKHSIGIALNGTKDKFPVAQIAGAVKLVRLLTQQYVIPYTSIYGHYQVSKEGKTCPNFKIEDFISLVRN